MYSWRRTIVGDAFKLYTRDSNYYRDLALLLPFLLFSIASVFRGCSDLHAPEDALLFHREVVAAIVCLLLAKEKLLLVAGAIGFVVIRGLVASLWHKQWLFVLGLSATAAAGTGVAMVLNRVGWRPSYEIPEHHSVVEVLIGVTSLMVAIFLEIRMSNWPPTTLFPKAFVL
jgi:hypothetical protein